MTAEGLGQPIAVMPKGEVRLGNPFKAGRREVSVFLAQIIARTRSSYCASCMRYAGRAEESTSLEYIRSDSPVGSRRFRQGPDTIFFEQLVSIGRVRATFCFRVEGLRRLLAAPGQSDFRRRWMGRQVGAEVIDRSADRHPAIS